MGANGGIGVVSVDTLSNVTPVLEAEKRQKRISLNWFISVSIDIDEQRLLKTVLNAFLMVRFTYLELVTFFFLVSFFSFLFLPTLSI